MLGKIALTAAVAVGGITFVMRSSASAERYFHVEELMAKQLPDWTDKELKIQGTVLTGSILEKIENQDTQRTFVLQSKGKRIRVFNAGPKPDTFKDESEVLATGHLVPSADLRPLAQKLGVAIESDMPYVLQSTELSAKCPSKYDGNRVKLEPQTPKFK
ncbi:MAG TPA: cytochrome c maturation protein CcmE [Kofleriaceae bacterium]|jgi:cytochrome c-type biogenesis protein CcmE|nr:cytochrome c maturation protein CcmE [Kofleriaceae bacterium]